MVFLIMFLSDRDKANILIGPGKGKSQPLLVLDGLFNDGKGDRTKNN